MRSHHLAIAAVTVCGLLQGCKRLKTGAREDFRQRYSCPDDRIEVKARDDLHAMDVLGVRVSGVQPPEDVKKDPARLAVWEQSQAEVRQRQAEAFAPYEVFEVMGCGHQVVLACRHPPTPETAGGYYPGLVNCQAQVR